MPTSAPVPVPSPSPADTTIDRLLYRPSEVYPEVMADLQRLAALQAEHETRISTPSVDLDKVAAEVSVAFPPLDSIIVATCHLDLTHEAHDYWDAEDGELEELQEFHRLEHLAHPQDHHHPDEPVRQPADVRELTPRKPSAPRRPARPRKPKTASNGTGAGAAP